MPIKRTDFHRSQDLAFTPPASPVGPFELAVIEFAMAAIAPDWSVELLGIRAEDTTLVLVPDSGEDASGPSFVISREACGFRLDQVRWDTMTEAGAYDSLNDVVDALGARLAFHLDLVVPATATVH